MARIEYLKKCFLWALLLFPSCRPRESGDPVDSLRKMTFPKLSLCYIPEFSYFKYHEKPRFLWIPAFAGTTYVGLMENTHFHSGTV